MRVILGFAILLGACSGDGGSGPCIWVPGGDGQCGGGSTAPAGPPLHEVESAAAAAIGGDVRVVMTGFDTDSSASPRIETSVVSGGVASEPAPIALDGAPLEGIVPAIASAGDHAYLAWNAYGGDARGAPLHGGEVHAAEIVELGLDYPTLIALDDGFVAIGTAGSTAIRGRWVSADGALVRDVTLADDADEGFAIASGADTLAVGWLRPFEGGRALVLSRFAGDGTPVGETELARAIDGTSWLGGISVAVLAGGAVLAIYGFQDGLVDTIHAARIEPDGRVGDQVSGLPTIPALVVSGDRTLALTLDDELEVARFVDERGTISAGPVALAATDSPFATAIATPDGFAVVSSNQEIVLTPIDRALTPGANTAVASSHEVGGCDAGGGGGNAGLALILLLTRRRAARARAPRSPHPRPRTAGCAASRTARPSR